MSIFNPLDLMARARARDGFKDPAYRAGRRVENGRWASHINNDLAAVAFGAVGALVNAIKPKNRRERRAARARARH